MKYPNVNVFALWFFLPHTLAMGWVAFAGRMLLELLGATTREGDIPGRLAGAVLLFTIIFVIRHLRHGVLPIVGQAGGSGYALGHKLVLIANLLAASLLFFELMRPTMTSYNWIHILSTFTDAFGYWVMGLWAIGLSLLYQSTLPTQKS
jgi:hypothetical protein